MRAAENATPQHSTVFKARPVNRKVLESAGDLGVPVIRKKAPTVPKEFALTSQRGKKVEPSWVRDMEKPLYSSFGGGTKKAPAPSSRANTSRKAPGVTAPATKKVAALPSEQPKETETDADLTKEFTTLSAEEWKQLGSTTASTERSESSQSEPPVSAEHPVVSSEPPHADTDEVQPEPAVVDINDQSAAPAGDETEEAPMHAPEPSDVAQPADAQALPEEQSAQLEQPPAAEEAEAEAAPAPASPPAQQIIMADDAPTPDTVEFHLN